MAKTPKNPKGWYLGLPYMAAACLRATQAQEIPESLFGKSAVFCDDILLQAEDWASLLINWTQALADNGSLILWVSDIRYRSVPDGSQRITLDDLLAVCSHISNLSVIEGEVIDGYSFVVAIKAQGYARREQPARNLLVCRFGAHGDALMASSILPGLKSQGWNITMMVRETGYAMLKCDPHIDRFIQIRAETLLRDERAEFWDAWNSRFDRVINLAETVEGALLKKPEQSDYYWTDDQRRALCGESYLELTHRAAKVAPPFRVSFYPTPVELDWANQTAQGLGKFIIWSLQGGAVHKWWPYVPQAVCQLLARTDYKIVLTGDAQAQELANAAAKAAEDYIGSAVRLKSLVNVRPLRDVLALAQRADIVIGPETALTNAVCHEAMPKVVFLSHSAPSNLTDDWINTTALTPNSPCYPCHRMHYGHDFCPQDEATGAAACAASVGVEPLVHAVLLAVAKANLVDQLKAETSSNSENLSEPPVEAAAA